MTTIAGAWLCIPSGAPTAGGRRKTPLIPAAKTKFFWDLDTAPLPNWDHSLLPNIDKALAAGGLSGDLFKTGRCSDCGHPPKPASGAVGRWMTAGSVYSVARVGHDYNKEAFFRYLLMELLIDHDDIDGDGSLVNYMVISGNEAFVRPLRLLRERGHNVVVARPSTASHLLDEVATMVWNWEELVLGKPPFQNAKEDSCNKDLSNTVLFPKFSLGMKGRNWAKNCGPEPEEGTEPTLVWWDMDSTPLPLITHPGSIAGNIEKALRSAGFSGPVLMHAYGDRDRLHCSIWDQLVQAGGTTYTHLPSRGNRDANINVILTDMAISTRDFPPPANYFLISCDYRFISVVDILDDHDYNVFLARSSTAPCGLEWSRMWYWEDLAEGGPPLPLSYEIMLTHTGILP